MQGKTKTVFWSTMCGILAYILFPLAGAALQRPEIGLVLFGLAGFAQVSIRLIVYRRAVKKMDIEKEDGLLANDALLV